MPGVGRKRCPSGALARAYVQPIKETEEQIASRFHRPQQAKPRTDCDSTHHLQKVIAGRESLDFQFHICGLPLGHVLLLFYFGHGARLNALAAGFKSRPQARALRRCYLSGRGLMPERSKKARHPVAGRP